VSEPTAELALLASQPNSLSEVDGEEAVRALQPLELDLAALAEVDTRADDQLAYEVRDEHLTPECAASDARGVVHGRAVEVVGVVQDVPGVDADILTRIGAESSAKALRISGRPRTLGAARPAELDPPPQRTRPEALDGPWTGPPLRRR
jgi:hypothetical protein